MPGTPQSPEQGNVPQHLAAHADNTAPLRSRPSRRSSWEKRGATAELAAQMLTTTDTLKLLHGMGAEVAAKQQENRRVPLVLPQRDEEGGSS